MNLLSKSKIIMFCIIMLISVTVTAQTSLPVVIEYSSDIALFDLDWSHDSKLLAIADANDVVMIYDFERDDLTTPIDDDLFAIQSIKWRPQSHELLIANNITGIWDYDASQWLESFEFPVSVEFQEYFHEGEPDWNSSGQMLAFVLNQCDESRPLSQRIEIWDFDDITSPTILGECVDEGLASATWHPINNDIAIIESSLNGQISFWSWDTNEEIYAVYNLRSVDNFRWNSTGELFGFAVTVQTSDISIDRVVQVRNFDDGEVIFQSQHNVEALDWHPLTNIIAIGDSSGLITIWDIQNDLQLAELSEHTDAVTDVVWSPDGRMLASIGRDGRLFIWNVSGLTQQDD